MTIWPHIFASESVGTDMRGTYHTAAAMPPRGQERNADRKTRSREGLDSNPKYLPSSCLPVNPLMMATRLGGLLVVALASCAPSPATSPRIEVAPPAAPVVAPQVAAGAPCASL